MIHEWILHNGICITYHSKRKWLQIDKIKINAPEQETELKSVRFKRVENSMDLAKKQGNYYWSDYSAYYKEGDTKTKGEPYSFYMRRNSQFKKIYENEEHIEDLKNVGFECKNVRVRRNKDGMPRIVWDNYMNTESIRSYDILDHSNVAEMRYKNSWSILVRYKNVGFVIVSLIGIGSILYVLIKYLRAFFTVKPF